MERIYNASTEYLPSCEHHTDEQEEDLLAPSDISCSTSDNESVNDEERSALDRASFTNETVVDDKDRTVGSHDSHTIEEERHSTTADEMELVVAIENEQISFDGPSEISWDNNKVPPHEDVIMDTEYV